MDIRGLYKRKSILFEAAGFGNVIFLTNEDKEFIRQVGIYAFEKYDKKHETNLKESSEMSTLYNMLLKESQAQLEDEKKVYWSQHSFNEQEEITSGFTVGSVSKKIIETEDFLLAKRLKEENIFLYLPVVEDWLNYYIPKSANDTIEAREVLRSAKVALEGQNRKRDVITYNNKLDLVEVVREGKNG